MGCCRLNTIVAVVAMVVQLNTREILACTFDCHYNDVVRPDNDDGTICAGSAPNVTVINNDIVFIASQFLGVRPNGVHQEIDLSNRGITSVAEDGLTCYHFVPYITDVIHHYTVPPASLELRGVNLAHNFLTEIPTLDQVTNISYVNISNNELDSLYNLPSNFSQFMSVVLMCDLSSNNISEIEPNLFSTIAKLHLLIVDLSFNEISSLPANLFPDTVTYMGITLTFAHNNITEVNSTVFSEHMINSSQGLDLTRNPISTLPSGLVSSSLQSSAFYLTLSGMNITSLPESFFNGDFTESILSVDLSENFLQDLPTGLACGTFSSTYVEVNLENNMVSTIPSYLFSSIFEGSVGILASMKLTLDHNYITELPNEIFAGPIDGVLSLSMNHNYVSVLPPGLFNRTEAIELSVLLNDNLIEEVPPYLFAGAGFDITIKNSYPTISLSLNNNGVRNISKDVFAASDYCGGPDFVPVNAMGIVLTLNNNPDLQLPTEPFSFTQACKSVTSFCTQHTEIVEIGLVNTSLVSLPLDLFTNFQAYSCLVKVNPVTLTLNLANNSIVDGFDYPAVDGGDDGSDRIYFGADVTVNIQLSHNGITYLPTNSFGGFNGTVNVSRNDISVLQDNTFTTSSWLTMVDLSHNKITSMSALTFNNSLCLSELFLHHNKLTTLTYEFTQNTPILRKLQVQHNMITALPQRAGSNRIYDIGDATENPLVCSRYVPLLEGCNCTNGQVYSEWCGYGRCMNTKSGCTDGKLPTSSCVDSPASVCISSCPVGQFLANDTLAKGEAACGIYSDCNTLYYPKPGYEFEPPTLTSNRVCAPCSICPVGFDFTPCTRTSDTVCTKTDHISGGDIAAIIISMILVLFGGIGGTSYMFLRKKKKKTDHELELSQLLLGEVEEDNARMKQGWEISESAIDFGHKLAEGAFGEVWAAKWGHIDVAVKLMHAHLAELDKEMDEFNKESTFMQSIKHPNLLIFYGAGLRANGTPYLVIEMMAKGSMRTLIREEELSWRTRYRFALEVALGMAHLHGLGSMHRDLKSDNCLVDNQYHVKVGDFGNSRLKSAYRKHQSFKIDHQYTTSVDAYNSGYGSGEGTPFSSNEGEGTKQDITNGKGKQFHWGPFHKNSREENHSYQNPELTIGVGTPLWMAPEIVNGTTRYYGPEVDVYSFGIVMWELLTRQTPWEDELSTTRTYFQFRAELQRNLEAGVRPQIPDWAVGPEYAPYVELMKLCWSSDPNQRPTFAVAASILRESM